MGVQTEDSGGALDEKELDALFLECRDAFKKAEDAIKQGELSFSCENGEACSPVPQGLFFPAINELRYAGQHMSEFNVSHKTEDLSAAISHCNRARSDAYDCLIQYCLREIRLFKEEYKSLVVGDVIRGYAEYVKQVKDISRRNGRKSEDTLESSVEICEEDYRILKEIYDIFDSNRDDLNAKLKTERNNRFYKILGILVPFLGVFIALITLIFKFF